MNKYIDIKTPHGICDSFVVYPNEGGPFPAVIFLMDAFGPRSWLYQMAEHIAAKGYYVLLPNLFYRFKKPPMIDLKFPIRAEDLPAAHQQLMALFQNYKYQQALADIGVVIEFLDHQPEVKKGKLALTGYCMGGNLAIRAAAAYADRFAAVASFHGGKLATDDPDSPHLLLNQIKANVYIGHADNDKSMPAEQISKLDEALKKTNLHYEAEVYQGAAHGFTMLDLPAGNEAALQRHWAKLFSLLGKSF